LISVYYDRFHPAAIAILLAIIIDGLDGRVARFTNACTDFGVEYDSLADFITFGIAPGVLVYSWALKPLGHIGILASFLFVICGALRLARFNVHFSEIKIKDFVGLPIPAAAGFLASLIILYHVLSLPGEHSKGLPFLISVYLLAFLMVSNIKYRSFKQLNLRKRKPFSLLVVLVLAILVIGSLPHILIFALLLSYVLSGPTESLIAMYEKRVKSRAEIAEKQA
jgi:CDP-diacylglycerol--serine O-phosphatidyltransferase